MIRQDSFALLLRYCLRDRIFDYGPRLDLGDEVLGHHTGLPFVSVITTASGPLSFPS
jgi:hypothetical protein